MTQRDGTAAVAGVVLTGGASRRMGRDKALIEVGGETLAGRVAATLIAAGLAPVTCVGGDLVALRRRGLVAVADDHPGEGPLGGVLTALARHRAADGVVVTACDLVAPSVGALARLLAVAGVAAPDAGVVVPVVAARRQWLHALWRPAAAPALVAAFTAGERSVARAAEAALTVHAYAEADPLADADVPGDLPAGAG